MHTLVTLVTFCVSAVRGKKTLGSSIDLSKTNIPDISRYMTFSFSESYKKYRYDGFTNSESRRPRGAHLGAVVTDALEYPTFFAVQAHTRNSLVRAPTAKEVGDTPNAELSMPMLRVSAKRRVGEISHL
jgi:hypothetical protein